jgi:hypothetical protein
MAVIYRARIAHNFLILFLASSSAWPHEKEGCSTFSHPVEASSRGLLLIALMWDNLVVKGITIWPGQQSMCLPVNKVQNLMTISFQLVKAELTIIALQVPPVTSKISKTSGSSRIRCSSRCKSRSKRHFCNDQAGSRTATKSNHEL